MTPAEATLTARRNATFDQAITLLDGGVAVDLTGWTVQMQVRLEAGMTGAPLADIATGVLTTNGSTIEVVSAVGGQLRLLITAADMATFPAMPAAPMAAPRDPRRCVYDILFTYPDTEKEVLLEGIFDVYEGVTR